MACEQNGILRFVKNDEIVFVAVTDEALFAEAFALANNLKLNDNKIKINSVSPKI
jgi:hypothetical protein